MAINVDIKPKTILQALEDIANAISGGDSGGGGSSGGGGLLVHITPGETENETVLDKTYAEIVEAAGGCVVFDFEYMQGVHFIGQLTMYGSALDEGAETYAIYVDIPAFSMMGLDNFVAFTTTSESDYPKSIIQNANDSDENEVV